MPWSRHAAIQEFYELLEWLNGPGSSLESNDCAFTGPHPNESPSYPKRLECSGRVMVLYRELAKNLSPLQVGSLKDALHHALASIDAEFPWGMIGTTIVPVRYVTLPLACDEQVGAELMISFWAWGDSKRELMSNLERVMRNLSRALHAV